MHRSILCTALLGGAIACPLMTAEAQTAPDTGTNYSFLERLAHAYLDELDPSAASGTPATDAPLTRRPAPFPPQPLTYPPYPFTDWNYGGSSTIGASLPNQVDSPLTTAYSDEISR